jgi:hypothetical protein
MTATFCARWPLSNKGETKRRKGKGAEEEKSLDACFSDRVDALLSLSSPEEGEIGRAGLVAFSYLE